MRRAPLVATATCAAVAVAALGAWQGPRLLGDDDGDRRAARAFAAAWAGGTLDDLRFDPASGDDPAAQVAALVDGLTPADAERPAEVAVRSVRRDGDRATASLDVRWELGQPWSYRTELPLRRTDYAWRPVLTPSVVHPDLAEGAVLRSRLEQAPRAAITDRTGAALVTDRPVVVVGLQPSRTTDLPRTVAQVAGLTDVDAAALERRAVATSPDAFVEVVVLRREAYETVRDRLRPVPGVVLREGTRQLAPTAAFARALLGRVGPATAEAVEASGGSIRADQVVGLSGLQEQFDRELGGTAGLTVEAVGPDGAARAVLHHVAPQAGRPLQLTLDAEVQRVADAALDGAPPDRAAALVVVQPSTGDVLAVANDGPDGPGSDRALTGRYPPGSTFKIASALALLRAGLGLDDVVPCPASVTVAGKRFVNAEAEVLGDQPFRTDFAHSCNTAFVGSADRITSAQLQTAARDLGYGPADLGIGSAALEVAGDVPTTPDAVAHAAQMIGQGEVLASPLAVAVSAATVADGRLRPPRLLAEAPVSAPGPVLPEAEALRALTRAVVTEGTGTALRDVPGEPVRGKTGTAEFGTRVPPQTHAWFAGSSGDLAFSVLVEDSGFGGAVAAPLAADLLRRLRS